MTIISLDRYLELTGNTTSKEELSKDEPGVWYITLTAEKGIAYHKTLGEAMERATESTNCWVYKEVHNKRTLIWRYYR